MNEYNSQSSLIRTLYLNYTYFSLLLSPYETRFVFAIKNILIYQIFPLTSFLNTFNV
jgi:hypothetical protein